MEKLLRISHPYGVCDALGAVRVTDGLLHEYVAARHLDDGDGDGDGHVHHEHAYGCDALHHDV